MPLVPTRNISAELLGAILAEAGTLTSCILITPATGAPVGFTAHDDDIVFDGQTYHTEPGLSATELAAVLTYAVDNLEISGAFDEDLIKRADVTGGVYDDAEYTIFVIDFENPAYGSMVVQRGTVGNADIIDDHFIIELRSLSQKLQKTKGELTSPLCRANIFDERCQLNPAGTHPTLAIPYRYAGVAVTTVINRFAFTAQITGVTIPTGYFEAGLLVWDAGANALQRSEVKTHTVLGDVHMITLQEPARAAFAVGDTFTVRKGCKKTLSACLDVQNVINKRSEDYLPGTVEILKRP